MSILFIIAFMACACVRAQVLQVEGGLSTGHFIDGFNVTDGHPIVFLGADASFDNGAFGGAECYESSSGEGGALPRGCHFYAGFFQSLNNGQAVSFELRHKNYLVESDFFWQYFAASADWSINKNLNLGITVTDDWLDSETTAYTVRGDYAKPLNELFTAYISAGVMKFSGVNTINFAEYFELGLKYQKKRWTSELSFLSADTDLVNWVGDLDINKNQLRLTLSYRFY